MCNFMDVISLLTVTPRLFVFGGMLQEVLYLVVVQYFRRGMDSEVVQSSRLNMG